MDRPSLTRRRFSIGLAAASSLPLAGCLSDGEDGTENDDDDNNLSDFELADRYTLTIHFENENGTPISSGIEGTAVPADDSKATLNISAVGIEEGSFSTKISEGEYTITITSTDDTFDDVEKEVTVDTATEVTVTLEGAQPAE